MKKTVKIVALALAVLMMASVFAGCTKTIKVNVTDMGESKEIEVKTDQTVEEALSANDIALGEKDEVEPAKDEKIAEDLKEIVIKRYAKVKVMYRGKAYEVEVVGATVKEAIEKSGIKPGVNEAPSIDETTYVTDGMEIVVGKQITIKLTLGGKTTDFITTATTVEELLAELKSKDEYKDKELGASGDSSSKLVDGMEVTVAEVTYKEVKEKETIDYDTETQYSDSMASGVEEITQQGVEGEKEVTYKVKYLDGKEDSKEKVSEKVIKEAVNQIVTIGTQEGGGNVDPGYDDGGDDGGKTVVSKQAVYDCDGSGHGYYVITYSDGSVEYEEF